MTEREKLAATIEGFAQSYRRHQLDGYTAGMTTARTRLSLFVLEHVDTLLAALRADSDAAVERAAEAAHNHAYGAGRRYQQIHAADKETWRVIARAALRAALEPQP